jgi:hypothetical protein
MNPDLFPLLFASTPVKALLGASPLRVFPWNRAPQNVEKPYAVYAVYNGNPENYMSNTPDIDNKGTQLNIYGNTSKSVEDCFIAIRNVIEPVAHMTSFSTPALDADTDLYSVTMEFDFWDER